MQIFIVKYIERLYLSKQKLTGDVYSCTLSYYYHIILKMHPDIILHSPCHNQALAIIKHRETIDNSN